MRYVALASGTFHGTRVRCVQEMRCALPRNSGRPAAPGYRDQRSPRLTHVTDGESADSSVLPGWRRIRVWLRRGGSHYTRTTAWMLGPQLCQGFQLPTKLLGVSALSTILVTRRAARAQF